MAAGVTGKALLAASLMLLVSLQAPAAGFAALLAEADRVRTADPKRYVQLLDELARTEATATDAQRRHLRLLQSHRRALVGESRQAVDSAIALFDEAPEPTIRYRAALLVANVSAVNRDYVVGLRYLDRAIALQPSVEEPGLRHLGDIVAGTLFNEFGHHDKALAHAGRVLAGRPSARDHCFAGQIRARAMHGLRRTLDEARDVQKFVADCTAQNEMIATTALHATLAEYWAAHGRRAEAIGLLEASLPAAEATGYARLVGEVRSVLAELRYEAGDRAAAAAHAQEIASITGQDARWPPYAVAHRVLYQVALARGDYRRALAQYRRYAEAEKAQLDDVKAREYAYHLVRHETRQQAQAVQLLTNQNQVLRLRQEVAERAAWNFRLAITLLTVLVATVAYWGWRGRRLHRSLRALADTDGLTGLNNRRAFRARTEAALAACAQRGRPVSVLLFDLDHFKQINDQCGHSAGDWVLREVARVTRQHCREGDLLGRIGGEEFAMALIDCDEAAALRIAEHCRQSIARIDAGAAGCPLPVAASIGVVGAETGGYDYEALIAHADAAMYRSKVAGRNRVTLYTPPPVPPVAAPVRLDSRNADRMLGEF